MAYQEKEIEKLYYTIGEVASMFDVNASLIRFWEKEFQILKPKKNKKGNRLFTKDDITNLRKIYNLVKEKGFTLQGAKEELKTKTNVDEPKLEVVAKLKVIKEYLLELKDLMDELPTDKVIPPTKINHPTDTPKKESTPTPEVSPNQISLFD